MEHAISALHRSAVKLIPLRHLRESKLMRLFSGNHFLSDIETNIVVVHVILPLHPVVIS